MQYTCMIIKNELSRCLLITVSTEYSTLQAGAFNRMKRLNTFGIWLI